MTADGAAGAAGAAGAELGATLAYLNDRYGIGMAVRFVAGPGDLPLVELRHPGAMASVSLLGATVLHYQPRDGLPVLFVSRESAFAPGPSDPGRDPRLLALVRTPPHRPHPPQPRLRAHRDVERGGDGDGERGRGRGGGHPAPHQQRGDPRHLAPPLRPAPHGESRPRPHRLPRGQPPRPGRRAARARAGRRIPSPGPCTPTSPSATPRRSSSGAWRGRVTSIKSRVGSTACRRGP